MYRGVFEEIREGSDYDKFKQTYLLDLAFKVSRKDSLFSMQ